MVFVQDCCVSLACLGLTNTLFLQKVWSRLIDNVYEKEQSEYIHTYNIRTSPWVKSYHLGLNPASHFAHFFGGLSASHLVKVVGV